jgi:predicted transcriptional regulator
MSSALTTAQIRGARAMLGWTAADLANHSGVAVSTIRRIEVQTGQPECHPRTVTDIQRAFEAAGIEFIGTPEDRPGVRVQK